MTSSSPDSGSLGSVAAVVPATARHMPHVLRLVREMQTWTLTPIEISIAFSSVQDSPRTTRFLEQLANVRGASLTVTSTADHHSAGENRNRGLEQLRTNPEWIAFVDADDYYRRDRLERLRLMGEHMGPDAIVHGYVRGWPPRIFERIHPRQPGTLILPQDFQRAALDRGVKSEGHETNVSLPEGATYAIHQGHAFVRHDVATRLSYNNLPVGEDGAYLRQLVAEGYRLLATPEQLSIYDPLARGLHPRRSVRLVRDALRRWI